MSTGDGAARPGLFTAAEFRGSDEAGARGELVERVASECGAVPSEVVLHCRPGRCRGHIRASYGDWK